MRILVLSPRQCWPPLSGAKLREYHLARALGRRALLTSIFFRQAGAPEISPGDLAFCREAVPLAPCRPYTPGKILRGVLGRWPLPVVNYTSAEMARAMERVLSEDAFDLVHVEGLQLAAHAEQLRRKLNVPIVFDWHNIESELMFRYGMTVKSAARRVYANFTARRLAALERRLLAGDSGHIVCSEREAAVLRHLAPRARIAVIENGVDASFYRRGSVPVVPLAERKRIVFTGLMSYHANVDAAVTFARGPWLEIRQRFGDWKLTIVGANPDVAVRALAGLPGVEVTGTVDDVRPYYSDALAAVVPLLSGSGTRLKILEAMAAGVPVISTSIGAEGLSINPGGNILIANNRGEWLPQFAALAGGGDLWNRIAQEGRRLVESRYDWELLGGKLFKTYSAWLHEWNVRPERP